MHALASHETRLRLLAGVPATVRPALTAWKGRSGARYVVSIFPLASVEVCDLHDAVALMVRRDRSGDAHLLEAMHTPAQSPGGCGLLAVWIALASVRGATEIHVHRLGEDAPRRDVIAADLSASDAAREAGFASSVG